MVLRKRQTWKQIFIKEVCTKYVQKLRTNTGVQMIARARTLSEEGREVYRVLTRFPGEVSNIQGSRFLHTIVISASFIYCSFLPVAPDFP